ncbi:MAG TPA: glycine cleavage system protein GcvH [Planctomycetota bacterium]|nr:glycine cleavage system protein GcvH [Planctomycetota bacterium]
MFPKDVRYTTTHEWVRLEDGEATVGITAYAAGQLSDINYVELPSVGDDLPAETALGTIESTETAVDLLSPIDGKVIETNDAVLENPELIAEDPYDDGWLVRLKPTDPSQLNELMTAEEYQIFVQAESGEELEEEEEEEEEAQPVEPEEADLQDVE